MTGFAFKVYDPTYQGHKIVIVERVTRRPSAVRSLRQQGYQRIRNTAMPV